MCLFIRGKNWKQPKLPIDRWTDKLWDYIFIHIHTHTMAHDSATKQYRLLLHAQHECISKTLCWERKSDARNYITYDLVCEFKSRQTNLQGWIPEWLPGRRVRGWDRILTAKGHDGTLWSDGNVPYIDLRGNHSRDMHILKIHQAVYLRFEHFITHKLYLILKI